MLELTILFVGETFPSLSSHHLRHISKILSFLNFEFQLGNA